MYVLCREGFHILNVVLQRLSINNTSSDLELCDPVSSHCGSYFDNVTSRNLIAPTAGSSLCFVFLPALWSYFKALSSSQLPLLESKDVCRSKAVSDVRQSGFQSYSKYWFCFLIFLFVLSRWVDPFSLPEEAPSDTFSFLQKYGLLSLRCGKKKKCES